MGHFIEVPLFVAVVHRIGTSSHWYGVPMTEPIVLMSYGRASLDKQLTWNTLSKSDKDRVVFAVRLEEVPFFEKLSNVFVLPKTACNLASTRQAIYDFFNEQCEFWIWIDDDTKSFSRLNSADNSREKIFDWEVIESHEALNASLDFLKANKDVGTCSPLQTFKPPRIPTQSHRWSTSLVVGVNAMASERAPKDFRFVSNYCGDTELGLTMLAHGYDTCWLDNYQINQPRPTVAAAIRSNSVEEWQDLATRFAPYIKRIERVTSGLSPAAKRNLADQPAKMYRVERRKLLNDARGGCLKQIVLSNGKTVGRYVP